MKDPRLKEFVQLFNSKQFFEAHEVLEALWLESLPPVKDYYKGLIQCAVAFVHLQRKNLRGAKKLFKTSCAYLRKYPDMYEGIDNAKLLEQFEHFFDAIEQTAEIPDISAAKTPTIAP